MMRIVVIGSVDFSWHCLREVLLQGADVVAILNPEQQYAGINSDYADLKPLADEFHIPLYRIRKVKEPETVSLIQALRPDIIFVFGFSQLIPPEVLSVPPKGCIGVHPTLLPRNRGRHPLIWALVEGLTESGLTFFYLDEGVDSGDIIWQRPFPITLEDDASTLYRKTKLLASEAIREMILQVSSGTAPRRPQDHSLATYWRKRTEKDGEIKWSGSALAAYNLIRALTHPYPGAHTFFRGHRVIIWRSRQVFAAPGDKDVCPGEIVDQTKDGFLVKCQEGFLELLAWEYSSGDNLRVGGKLGDSTLWKY